MSVGYPPDLPLPHKLCSPNLIRASPSSPRSVSSPAFCKAVPSFPTPDTSLPSHSFLFSISTKFRPLFFSYRLTHERFSKGPPTITPKPRSFALTALETFLSMSIFTLSYCRHMFVDHPGTPPATAFPATAYFFSSALSPPLFFFFICILGLFAIDSPLITVDFARPTAATPSARYPNQKLCLLVGLTFFSPYPPKPARDDSSPPSSPFSPRPISLLLFTSQFFFYRDETGFDTPLFFISTVFPLHVKVKFPLSGPVLLTTWSSSASLRQVPSCLVLPNERVYSTFV